MLLVPCEYSYSTGKWEDYISSDVCALRWYLGKLSLNFIAFCKSGSGRRKRAKTNTSFDMCGKWTNKKIFEEFERNKNLGCLSKYAFEQLFHSLSQENGDCYTSCHLVPAQQHCICCTPQKFFLKEGSVINLPIWNQTIILVVLLIVLCQSSKSVISKKKRWTFFFFFSLIVITGSRKYLDKAGGSGGIYIIQTFFGFLFHTWQVPIPCI